MTNGTIVEIITCGMATDNSFPYMVFLIRRIVSAGITTNRATAGITTKRATA